MAETPSYRYDPWRFLKIGLIMLGCIFVFSTAVYYLLGVYYHKNWTLMDCVFMVAITLSTIGYGDWLDLRGKTLAEIFTILLAFVGIGVPAFLISTVTALIVDGTIGDTVRRKRMQQEISKLSGHTIVCGAGSVGEHCIRELLKLGRKIVVIDYDAERLKHLQFELGAFPYVVGSAENDETLVAAGIKRAGFLIAALTDDKNNLFITLSANVLNPKIRIASKAIDDNVRRKMLQAGAASVVSPSAIGGLRLVSELVRPATTNFLDGMLRDRTAVRFGELTLRAPSVLIGKTLNEAALRQKADVLIVAAKSAGDTAFTYNPKADFGLKDGCVLVVMGPTEEIERLRPVFGDDGQIASPTDAELRGRG
ncbi:MAG TPA: potassium channel protein [Planctomycetota bacterium]|nr:potassium channel protein [Planctomycetota bacterium]